MTSTRLSRARLHIKAVIPPGDWLLGALPHNTFRVESCKLTHNDNMQLLTNGITIPFDGQVHDVRVDPSDRSRAPSGVLCIGSHLSLFLRNNGESPEPIEIQVAGTTCDGPPQEEGTKVLPELGCKVVLGIVAQEVVREVVTVGAIPADEIFATVTEHAASAERGANIAFQSACMTGIDADIDAYYAALERSDRLFGLKMRAQVLRDRARQTPEFGLTLSE